MTTTKTSRKSISIWTANKLVRTLPSEDISAYAEMSPADQNAKAFELCGWFNIHDSLNNAYKIEIALDGRAIAEAGM